MKRALLILGALGVVLYAERRWPLRRRREPSLPHVLRDAAMAAMSTAATMATQSIVLQPALRRLEKRGGILRVVAGVLMLDYSLWIWHWLNHRVRFLWRFHRVHHVDLDLDAATGARFHFGEMILSTFFRSLQLRVIDPDPRALSIWQTALMVSILFHHSNTRLPEAADRALDHVIVTPRMHGIHHSIVLRETDSNFASLFTIWDIAHGVFRIDVRQEAITIGVPAYQNGEDVTLERIVAMPLLDTANDWLEEKSQHA